MKAAVLVRQDAALEIYELEMPKLDVGQVLVKVEHSGICGKQIDEITGRQGEDRYLPHLLGHEGGGQVVEIGPGVKKVKPGDRVVMHWVKGSGIDSPPPRFHYKGQVLSAGWVTTFSNYTIASENRLTPMPDGARSDVLALLGCCQASRSPCSASAASASTSCRAPIWSTPIRSSRSIGARRSWHSRANSVRRIRSMSTRSM